MSFPALEKIEQARKAKEIIDRYNLLVQWVDLSYRLDMLALFNEPQPGLFNAERWTFEEILERERKLNVPH